MYLNLAVWLVGQELEFSGYEKDKAIEFKKLFLNRNIGLDSSFCLIDILMYFLVIKPANPYK